MNFHINRSKCAHFIWWLMAILFLQQYRIGMAVTPKPHQYLSKSKLISDRFERWSKKEITNINMYETNSETSNTKLVLSILIRIKFDVIINLWLFWLENLLTIFTISPPKKTNEYNLVYASKLIFLSPSFIYSRCKLNLFFSLLP